MIYVPAWFEAVCYACKDIRPELLEFVAHVRECKQPQCSCRFPGYDLTTGLPLPEIKTPLIAPDASKENGPKL